MIHPNEVKKIVLIGFKAVGKSALGRELAKQLILSFVDLDEKIEQTFFQENGLKLTCRQIMLKFGQEAFRQHEHETLKQILASGQTEVIAAGGGMPMFNPNRQLVKAHNVIQITAPKNIVFERIMISGRPAFFPENTPPLRSFHKIWAERQPIYDSLAKIVINNDDSLQNGVEKLKQSIKTL